MKLITIFIKDKKGQTLLEATIALAALLIILSATSTAIVTSISNAVFVRNQNLASKYAQEGMEFLRSVKVNNYQVFSALSSGLYCLGDATALDDVATDLIRDGTGDCTSPYIDSDIRVGAGNEYQRMVQIDQADTLYCGIGGAGNAKVTVTVSWASGRCTGSELCHKSELVACLTGY